jgi:hypothetical protein
MKIFKISKINNMSTSGAIMLGSIIIGVSIFLTTWIFFGGEGNRLKLSAENPTNSKPTAPNTMTPEQIKKIQEQRAEQMKKTAPTPTPVVAPTPTEE